MTKRAAWQDLLIPVGAAMLSVGARQLHDRAQHEQAELNALGQMVAFRREQLAGDRDIMAEPEPDDLGPDYRITGNGNSVIERSGSKAFHAGRAAVLLIVFGTVALAARRLWRAAMDDFELEDGFMGIRRNPGYGDPSPQQGTAHPEPDPMVPEPDPMPEPDPDAAPETTGADVR